MVDNLSLGPVQVSDLDPASLNDALRQLSERIDELKGLRGRTVFFDRARVEVPVQADDAQTLGGSESALTATVTTTGAQTITGVKTIRGVAFRITDSTGVLLHAFGATV